MIPGRGTRWIGVALLAALAGAAGSVRAQVDVRAYVEPSTGITELDPLQLVIQVNGAQGTVPAPVLRGLENLKVVAGPQTSSEFRWVNGRSSSTFRLSYALIPDGPGPASIPALELTIAGKTYSTEPIRFDVAEAEPGAPRRAPDSADRSRRATPAKEVYLESRLGASSAYKGQTVPLSVTLVSAERVTGFDWESKPAFPNFWVEDDEVDADGEAYRTSRDGRTFVAYPLERKFLVPGSAGEFEIDPFVGRVQVRIDDDRFGFFSLGRSEMLLRKTAPAKLTVKDLPAAGRPEFFSGAVGKFELSAELDRDESNIDEALSLKVTVEGEGFLKSVRPPRIQDAPNLKVFDPESNDRISIRSGKLVSRKTWEWVLIPLQAGELRLPEMRFAYFDPTEERYVSLAESLPVLSVKRGDGTSRGQASSAGPLRAQRRDIAFIKPRRGELAIGAARVHEQGWFVALMLLPLLWVPAWIVAGRLQSRLRQDRGLARARKARAEARRRLRAAGKQLEQQDAGTFHEGLSRALVQYVADHFNVQPAGLTYDHLDQLLAGKAVDGEVRRRFRSCLESCDFARFVPSAAQHHNRRQLLEEARDLIETIEKGLSR